MSNVKIIGSNVPNMPWQERPAHAKTWMPLWRYSENPVIGRNPVEGVARIFNSAVIPYEDGFIGVFRGEQINGIPYIYLGRSADGIHWDFEKNKIPFKDEEGRDFMPVYAYDPRLVKVEGVYYIMWCQDFYGASIGMAKTTDFKTFTRLENPFLPIIATSPSVVYEVELTDKSIIHIDSPSKLPDQQKISSIREPYVKTSIFTPSEYIGPIMELCQNKRGNYLNMDYIDPKRVNIHYEIPLSEIIYDFFDKLKSYTKGYASFDYEFIGYRESKLVKMDILLNGDVVDAFSVIVHKDFAYARGKAIVNSLKELIPRQMFEVPIQASIGSKVIARTDIKALRKNVLAKCYGGDVTRKRKLLEKQKEGKKRMKQIGSVEVPQEAFLAILKMDDSN